MIMTTHPTYENDHSVEEDNPDFSDKKETTMTEEKITQIEARANAAEPGDWVLSEDADKITTMDCDADEYGRSVYYSRPIIEICDTDRAEENGAFIVTARDDIRALIAALRAAKIERDTAIAAHTGLRKTLLRIAKVTDVWTTSETAEGHAILSIAGAVFLALTGKNGQQL